MKIRNILPEFKIAGQPDPKDAADYKEKMKTLQQIQNDPKMRDPQTQATIAKRKEELRRWAEKNMPKNEDAPFDGMGLVRMALMKKFITAEEWHGLKDKWKDAVEELEQKYDDWPEDQGFGSSDHNYAIKELMELVGYKFDDQDTSGRFVVSKMPPELEKMGIKNARMKDAVTTDEDADIDAQMKSDVLQFLNSKVVQIEKQIELAPAKTPEEKENKEFALKLFNFVQAKLEQKDNGDNTITVPKSMMKKEDLDYKSEDILNKAGFDPADIDTYMKVFNDHGDTTDIKQMNMKEKVGLADVMSIVLSSHGIQNK
mgnify:FL=1|tara:strand:- start:904 stop:1845 length:942 start_codon:yes stop_codon:yes gene_type:complete